MGKINVLGFDVANLIAAGEVVDRPSSAVKELLENAIDSGATSITVEIKNGGTSFIRITDNGCGMEISSLKEGFGLSGMHARAESLGGNVWFETEPDEGFEIHLTLPADGDKGGKS